MYFLRMPHNANIASALMQRGLCRLMKRPGRRTRADGTPPPPQGRPVGQDENPPASVGYSAESPLGYPNSFL